MNQVRIGDIYESTDARRWRRIKVRMKNHKYAFCHTKRPGDARYEGRTLIALSRLCPKHHWRLVRRGS